MVTPVSTVGFAIGFGAPEGMAFDNAGNLYVSNLLGSVVKRVTSSGTVSDFFFVLSFPWGLAFDTTGNLYAANLSKLYAARPERRQRRRRGSVADICVWRRRR